MELRHLRYFVAVAEELSFTRAAERLGIKQPPLSLQIRQLEIEMGTPLFRRLTRRIELTGAGSLLLEEARDILESVDRAKTDVTRRARGESGQISIGHGSGAYFHPMVNHITREYCARYPGAGHTGHMGYVSYSNMGSIFGPKRFSRGSNLRLSSSSQMRSLTCLIPTF